MVIMLMHQRGGGEGVRQWDSVRTSKTQGGAEDLGFCSEASDRPSRTRKRRAGRRKLGRSFAMFLLAAGSFISSPSPAKGERVVRASGELRDFASNLKQSLLAAGASRSDINIVLEPLVDVGAIQAIVVERPAAVFLAETPSLLRREQVRARLDQISKTLRTTYGLKRPRSTGGIVLGPEEKLEPKLSAWLLLRLLVEATSSLRIPTSQRAAPSRHSLLRWRAPMRVASTGNASFDHLIERALKDLRTQNPALPIDDATFPAALEAASMFVDPSNIQCPESTTCRTTDTASAMEQAETRWSMTGWRSDVARALIFFARLDKGALTKGLPIYAYNAQSDGHATIAWLRGDRSSNIDAAVCTLVTGPGTRGLAATGLNPGPASETEIYNSIFRCLAAALGAPANVEDWSLLNAPGYVVPSASTIATYSQTQFLRALYSNEEQQK